MAPIASGQSRHNTCNFTSTNDQRSSVLFFSSTARMIPKPKVIERMAKEIVFEAEKNGTLMYVSILSFAFSINCDTVDL